MALQDSQSATTELRWTTWMMLPNSKPASSSTCPLCASMPCPCRDVGTLPRIWPRRRWRRRGALVDRSRPGSNLKAWLFAILRNELYSRQRRDWRQVPWNDALGETIAAPPGEQQWAAELSDTACAMRGLSDPQREALILVGVGGFSHDDAAALSKTPVGTVKSRVGRARKALKEILDSENVAADQISSIQWRCHE